MLVDKVVRNIYVYRFNKIMKLVENVFFIYDVEFGFLN